MEFLEQDLEDIIFEADKDFLSIRGLHIQGLLLRQVRIGKYGIADLISVNRSYNEPKLVMRKMREPVLEITVYELKRIGVDKDTFIQAVRYVRGIQRYLYKRKFKFDVIYRVVLIGKIICLDNDFLYLPNVIPLNNDYSEFLKMYNYTYEVDGINFHENGNYKLNDEGF